MNNIGLKDNITIEIRVVDGDKSIIGTTTTTQLNNLHQKHNIDGLSVLFNQLYNELINK